MKNKHSDCIFQLPHVHSLIWLSTGPKTRYLIGNSRTKSSVKYLPFHYYHIVGAWYGADNELWNAECSKVQYIEPGQIQKGKECQTESQS
ncbi:hypothetical protein WN944_002617 [Citrus x changshan-huyou]|uniref:Uncharacterized protein n=1 Tax=Citrus x changshan-huyou TaxID=2935761 RepID=A0AAP0MGW3_9ROSI